jgi:GT2 family glycosyltransferase/SAM-dependent methyltransferase
MRGPRRRPEPVAYGIIADMALPRRPGAPRLIDWTGERCVPWTPDIQVLYEHFHRYMWAGELVTGRRVLDLASGEGFGAALLSERAASVIGVDIDETSVHHAQRNYDGENLEYRPADARDLSQFSDASFDVVVAFELIEHIAEQDAVFAEITRVLAPGGLLIVSTPERHAYDNGPGGENPFHVHELARGEFDALLASHFGHRRMWAQHVASGSQLRALDTDGPSEPVPVPGAVDSSSFLIEPDGEEWRPTAELPLLYMVALASDAELPPVPSASSLGDADLRLVSSREHALAARLNAVIKARDAEIAARGEAITTLDTQAVWLRTRMVDWQARYERAASDAFSFRKAAALRLNEQEAAHARETHDSAVRAAVLEARLRGDLDRLGAQLAWSDLQLRQIGESILYRGTQLVKGKLIATLGGEGSVSVRTAQATLRWLWRARRAGRGGTTDGGVGAAAAEEIDVENAHVTTEPAPGDHPDGSDPAEFAFAPVDFELSRDPVISIVMPLYAGAELTHRALQTIRDNTFYTRYEVILVNDGEDPATAALLESVSGARIVTNDENLGYLRSVNRGAQIARGRWLVLANNDIEVLPNWAAELLDCGESAADIAIVTPMYLQPDGRISEAGGIIWNDAGGHNYGRNDHADGWRYRWRREVDYGSAAALLVRTDVWREVGGFDERFLPMYYEDVDLCFAVRAKGYRVIFEPHARVLHREGSSAGTVETEGHKRHQALNRPRFFEKWAEVLSSDHLPPPEDAYGDWAGATARRRQRILVIDHRMPFWDKDAGAVRTLELLKSLMARGHHVTFMPDNGVASAPYAAALERLGIEVMSGPDLLTQLSLLIAPHLRATIVSRPSVAIRYMTLLRHHAPQATIIYDTVDLHWVRESRQAALLHDHHEVELLTQQALWTRSLELALVRAADVTLVATAPERIRVEAEVPGSVVRVLPTINAVRADAPGLDGRAGIIFVGGFEHTPNIDAVLRLVTGVMPRVWEVLPDVTLRVIGPDAPPLITELASERVEILGWVPDVEPLLDAARVTVAPLSFGAGMKGKITQALAAGLPVVTTPVGAEGFDVADDGALLIGIDDADLAERAIRVLTDDDLWHQMVSAGRDMVDRQCSPTVVLNLLAELFEADAPGEDWVTGDAVGLSSS